MKKLKQFKPLWNLIKEDKVSLIIASIFIFITELSTILTGYLNGSAVEAITNLALKSALIYLLIYLFIEIVFDSFISTIASAMFQKIENKLTRKLGFNAYVKALNLPAYAYEKTSSGEIINRITNDADTLSFAFERLLAMFTSFIGSAILLVYIFACSWIIGLIILIFLVLLYFILKKYNPLLKEAHKERKGGQDKFTTLVTESIRGIREIKTLGIKSNLIGDMKNIIEILISKSNNETDIWKKSRLVIRILKALLETSVFIMCVILLYYKQINLTFFIAMTYYVYRYMYLLESINDFTQTYQRVTVALGRVNELLLNTLYKDEEFGNKKIKNVKGVIEFKNVDFGYPNEDTILKNFNLKIMPNKKVAIVGKSGQGKSTLFNLITRVFDPSKGYITLDGIKINELSEEELRRHISIIRQEPFIFNKTIKDNFKLIDERITLKEIRDYTRLSYLDDYIMSLPKKYNTLLGEGGVNLSGGQKQRLSIARTLAKKSKVILFDEATSALDNNSQEYVKKAIDDLVVNHTVVIVAHRLSTIIDADIIYVVDDGKIVAEGKHEELLKTCEVYQSLYHTESLNSNE